MKPKDVKIIWLTIPGILILGIMAMGFWPGDKDELQLPEKVDFNYHIRPILSQNCFVCHGPDSSSREAFLRLDNFDGATLQLEHGGAAIVPGNPNKSLLVQRVSSDDPDFRMPPPEANKILTAREVALLKKWIRQGAKWQKHWAFISPAEPRLPRGKKKDNPADIIDFLVDQKMHDSGMSPSPTADKNQLIRRVSYLLTGLPPDPGYQRAFAADSAQQAYEKMVDHFLESPHFGERWARHWMDLVRYGEHKGHEFDYPIGGAWHYRDYLIRAFNKDVPYDMLVKEHLAGDMLSEPRYDPDEGFNESVLGTAYFYLGDGTHSPVNLKADEAGRIDNMIDVTSKTFQGLTVACARCHDHKFDPIPTTDYYAMYGMLESARIGPLQARNNLLQTAQVERLKALKGAIKTQLGKELILAAEEINPASIEQIGEFVKSKDRGPTIEKTIHSQQRDSNHYRLLGDFRTGHWQGWYTTGCAFGDGPLKGEPQMDRIDQRLTGLRPGMASSRYYGPGVQGSLRSPNFMIDHDFVAVKAAGFNGTIRVIVDNFQLIQNPIWGSLERKINDEAFRTYFFDVSMAKGHKAYLEFIPGHYGNHEEHGGVQNLYRIKPRDFIEVQYAFISDNQAIDLPSRDQQIPLDISKDMIIQAISVWTNDRPGQSELDVLNYWLQHNRGLAYSEHLAKQVSDVDSIASMLYDSTHFLGISEGDAVFSPVFVRGDYSDPGHRRIPHGFLTAVRPDFGVFPQEGSGRLAWAEGIVDPDNPLTARVMVNRIWHHLFGRGIVETVDNFGVQGKLPSHPELLDYLAICFMKEEWSIKKMIRHVLMTQSFRRSTVSIMGNEKIDPDNINLHHYPVRRLEGEAIRDGILATSGSLDATMYGTSVPIHLTEFMTGRGRPRTSGPLDGQGRRSIYTIVRRNFVSPLMLTFDMPIPFSTFGRRNTTNVPAQSLALMNDPFVHDQARKWADHLLEKPNVSIAGRINDIYIRAYARSPSTEEIAEAESLLNQLATEYGLSLEEIKEDPRIWAEYCHLIFNTKEFIYLL